MARKTNLESIDRFHMYDLHVETRTIFMGPETTHETAEIFFKNMHHLESLNSEPIRIIMTNDGGDWIQGMGIYDTIANSPCHVSILVKGFAASMGSIILQAADDRILYPNSKVLIHYGQLEVTGHPHNVQRWVDDCKKEEIIMEQLYLKKIQEKQPDFTISQLRKRMSQDYILTAEEAVELNLADRVYKGSK